MVNGVYKVTLCFYFLFDYLAVFFSFFLSFFSFFLKFGRGGNE